MVQFTSSIPIQIHQDQTNWPSLASYCSWLLSEWAPYIPSGPQIYLQLTLSPFASDVYLFSRGDASASFEVYGYTDDPESATAFILDETVHIYIPYAPAPSFTRSN